MNHLSLTLNGTYSNLAFCANAVSPTDSIFATLVGVNCPDCIADFIAYSEFLETSKEF